MTLGGCPALGTMTANIFTEGGAEGVWAGGVFTATLPPGSGCSENADAFAQARVVLTCNGCGKLRVTVAGQGGKFVAGRNRASVFKAAAELLAMVNTTSEADDCSTEALTAESGASPVEINVACGTEITLAYKSNNTEWNPELEAIFTVEVI